MSTPTRDEIVSALRVLGHSEPERLFSEADEMREAVQCHVPVSDSYAERIGAFQDLLPAVWAHVNHSKPNT